jgi:hypothetical protein
MATALVRLQRAKKASQSFRPALALQKKPYPRWARSLISTPPEAKRTGWMIAQHFTAAV